MARLVRWDPDGVEFRLDDGAELRLTAHDVLECAPDGFDPLSGQRLAPLQDQPDDIRIIAAAEREDGWLIEIDGVGTAALNPDDLGPYLNPRAVSLSAVPWTAPPPRVGRRSTTGPTSTLMRKPGCDAFRTWRATAGLGWPARRAKPARSNGSLSPSDTCADDELRPRIRCPGQVPGREPGLYRPRPGAAYGQSLSRTAARSAGSALPGGKLRPAARAAWWSTGQGAAEALRRQRSRTPSLF